MDQSWQLIIVEFYGVDANIIDLMSSYLIELGAIGTEVKYAPNYLENHPDLFGEIPLPLPESYLAHPVQVMGYFEEASNMTVDEVQSYLQPRFQELSINVYQEAVQDEHWQEKWMDFYKPERLTRHLMIVPKWQEYTPKSNESVIYLDPGLAFGTGNHTTTQLGAQALSIVMQPGDRVLDVGTGSGILSFVAVSLGASAVLGMDLDPQAVSAAKDNLSLQRERDKTGLYTEVDIHFRENDLMTGINEEYDVIVANILPHILVDMFADAYRQLTPSGYLILGGILIDKGPMIEEALKAHHFVVKQKTQAGEWLGYIVQKGEA